MTIQRNSKIYVAGHNGLVGSAILRYLQYNQFTNLLFRRSDQLDLRDQQSVNEFFKKERPEYVILAAAKVGGIVANNSYPANFIYENLMIQTNVIHASYEYDVKKLLFLGSSCIYPKNCPQPIKEDYLLDGKLEPTNEPYAIAKIAGIKMCQSYHRQYGCNFLSVMPTNLYGPNDNFDLQNSHVLPALIRKIHEAKCNNTPYTEIWGTGKPKREFLHVDDLADAIMFLMNHYNNSEIINIGTGKDISITELTNLIAQIVNYNGELTYDHTKPDGTLRKVLDITKINKMGWKPKIELQDGIRRTYEWYLRNKDNNDENSIKDDQYL